MSEYADHLRAHLRLTMLRLLARAPGYAANTSVLADGAAARGFRVSRDQVHTEVSWLEDQGLVTTEKLGSVTVVTVTGRGVDAAEGRTTVPGVKRPSPQS